MDEYLEKYGQNAIQAYKKSLRLSQSLQRDHPSPPKQELHLLPKKSLSKRSLKSALSKRNDSQTKLPHSKSIKKTSSIQDQQRKKISSFIDGSKKITITGVTNGFSHTFNKLNNNAGKKKLTINSSNTPKCSTPKMNINLNLYNKQVDQHKSSPFHIEQKDKLTQRIQRSSGKKNMEKCSTSQSKSQTKRQFLASIESRLEDLLIRSKMTLKGVSQSLRHIFDIILMSEQDIKLRKLFLLLKQVVNKVCGMGQKYKQKYTRVHQKMQSMEMIHHNYLVNEISHTRKKSKQQSETCKSNKKKISIQGLILNQNYELRKKIHKLQKQLEYYTSQSASLNNVFGKFKNSQSQINIGNDFNHDDHSSFHKNQLFSNNKLEKRRSSENLLYNQTGGNHFAYGVEKRLSFDPALLETATDPKKRVSADTLYNSIASSKQNYHHKPHEYDFRRGNNHQQVQQLSEQQDSQNQQ